MSVDHPDGVNWEDIGHSADALKPDTLPPELVNRQKQRQRLVTSLSALGGDGIGDSALILGPTGSGKTTLARMAIEEIVDGDRTVTTATVDCVSYATTPSALHQITRELGVSKGFKPGVSSTGEYLTTLRDRTQPTLVLLDDIYRLDSLDIIYSLYEIPHVTVVATARDRDEIRELADSQTLSRLRAMASIQMPQYTVDETADIVRQRAEWAEVDPLLTDEIVSNIATIADGDARSAIYLLRTVVKRLRDGDVDEISDETIANATWDAAYRLARSRYLSLERGPAAVCEALAERGRLLAGELHTEVEQRLGQDVTSRTRQRWLDELTDPDIDLVDREGGGPSTEYVPHPALESILSDESDDAVGTKYQLTAVR